MIVNQCAAQASQHASKREGENNGVDIAPAFLATDTADTQEPREGE